MLDPFEDEVDAAAAPFVEGVDVEAGADMRGGRKEGVVKEGAGEGFLGKLRWRRPTG